MDNIESSSNPTSAISWIENLWNSVRERAKAHGRIFNRDVPTIDRAQTLSEAILSERGEASGAMVASELHHCLQQLTDEEKRQWYRFLAERFLPDETNLRKAAHNYLQNPTAEQAAELTKAAEPPRQELLRRLNMAPGATATLVEIRQDLRSCLRQEPALWPLEYDLHHLLSSWFNRGFLELQRISWQTPAALLEKLITYEAVHQIHGWDDLRRRLAADRRCFGFFHPSLPGEPLIFVEVALVVGLANAIEPLVTGDYDETTAHENEAATDTAIFYSISNCQAGLRGISFGNFLIKQVVEELTTEIPSLVNFATLSPIPKFRGWLQKNLFEDRSPMLADRLKGDEKKALLEADGNPQSEDAIGALAHLLESGDWGKGEAKANALRDPLLRFCAIYLTNTSNSDLAPTDPVAGFHLRNGARLERINWLANQSPQGMEQSFGLMANYLYVPKEIEANHEAFVHDGTVTHSSVVAKLLHS